MIMDARQHEHRPDDIIRKRMKLGLFICAFTVFGLGGFAAAYEIAGAVLAGGYVVEKFARASSAGGRLHL